MEFQTVFSIGYGKKKIEVFVKELHSFDIKLLIDIRSKPYSKYNPNFSQAPLKSAMEREFITYSYMGLELGGLPTHDVSCFTGEGHVDYGKVREKDFFKKGLQQLVNVNSQKINVCIMCSESNPKDCHRSKLIGVELQKKGINLRHIVGISKEKSQDEVIDEITQGCGLTDLFGNERRFQSKRTYI